jgi:hypothetical protein
MKVLNAFSLSMLPRSREGRNDFELGLPVSIEAREVGPYAAADLLCTHGESYVGHADAAAAAQAAVRRQRLSGVGRHPENLTIPVRRESVTLDYGEMALVVQYHGPRLPEGATVLPDGAELRWYTVRVLPTDAVAAERERCARILDGVETHGDAVLGSVLIDCTRRIRDGDWPGVA